MDSLIEEAQIRIKNKRNKIINSEKKSSTQSNYISNLFTRTLLSVILVLACAIFVHMNDKNLLFFKEKLFSETLAFTKINALYSKYFGEILPKTVTATPVFSEPSITSSIESWNYSYKVEMSGPVTFLESGIVVFSGEKENFGNTVIVQGVDGVDIWYSHLENINLTMYDYVEKGNILGNAINNEIIYTFMENGNYIGYDNYLS